MKISYRGDYALKAVLDLALHYDSGVMTIHELARRSDIPIKFLEQILLDLKLGGFVQSRRGKVGGYLLFKPPSQIKVGDVVRFIEGPTNPIACVVKDYSGCSYTHTCVFRGIWQEVDKAISGVIDAVTFEDLVNQTKDQQRELAYPI